MPADRAAAQDRAARALAVPLLHFLGAGLIDERDPAKGILLVTTSGALNAAGWLHGGAIATVLDVAAYLAVTEALAADEEAMTHGFSASYLAGVTVGEELRATARVLRRGRHIAFIAAELRTNDRLIATATVTKSIRQRA
jgi:acyl-CoA thioesterase